MEPIVKVSVGLDVHRKNRLHKILDDAGIRLGAVSSGILIVVGFAILFLQK